MTFDPHHNPCQRIEDMLLAIASIRESVTGVTYEQFLIHGYIKTNWKTVWNTATTELDSLESNLKDMQAAFPWPIP